MRALFLVSYLPLAVFAAESVEPVKFVSGGKTSIDQIKKKEPKLSEKVGVSVEFADYNADLAITNLTKGVIDGFIGAKIDGALVRLSNEKKINPQNSGDFESFLVNESTIIGLIHPDNKVRNFSKSQFISIIEGNIKNWKELGGEDRDLVVYVPSNFVFINEALARHYLGKANAEAIKANRSIDINGVIRAIKRDPGVIGFGTSTYEVEGFTPVSVPTEAKRSSFLTIRKDARPEVKKVFTYLKSKAPF